MDEETQKLEELHELVRHMESEVSLLREALENRGINIDDDYADKVMRSELEEIGELVETTSETLGVGEAISITKPSDLREQPDSSK